MLGPRKDSPQTRRATLLRDPSRTPSCWSACPGSGASWPFLTPFLRARLCVARLPVGPRVPLLDAGLAETTLQIHRSRCAESSAQARKIRSLSLVFAEVRTLLQI